MDLALTATYIPSCRLTFAVLFGCPLSVEQSIIRRLKGAISEAGHPLLMPGIFVEIERTRHLRVIEKSVCAIEKRITSLAYSLDEMEAIVSSQRDRDNQEKRDQWLDTTFLRNHLLSWNLQLRTMASHVNELVDGHLPLQIGHHPSKDSRSQCNVYDDGGPSPAHLKRVSIKVGKRLGEIINEYDDKIRDCTMRVDGMAMATQWVRYSGRT